MTEAPRRAFRKVLVANRGEIAVRVLRTLRELGIRGAVVYSDADRKSLPVLMADEAYRIGPPPSRESYLRAEAIVELAVAIGADGIHPGYGFLSENARFAELCAEAGVELIGPPATAIAAMGSKIESRRLMLEAGVPAVPGGRDPLPDLAAAEREGEAIGYPVMLKAAAGGGGKGMRLIGDAGELAAAYRAARAEAAASFGDDAVYMEKLLVRPRHVEIQVVGDKHGGLVSLGERECSLQRRHQKVVEEAPSTVVSPALRAAMGAAAVKAARAVGYWSAGTVEFLLDRDGSFYFLEMNTRLQVEHPVTELVTGLDLVRAQLAIAQGEPLPEAFVGVVPRGHAIEVRLYAEDPYRNFAPSPGRIELSALARGARRAQRRRRLREQLDPHPLRPDAGQVDRLGSRPRAGVAAPRARPRRAARRGSGDQRAALPRAAARRRVPRRRLRHLLARPQAQGRGAAAAGRRRRP